MAPAARSAASRPIPDARRRSTTPSRTSAPSAASLPLLDAGRGARLPRRACASGRSTVLERIDLDSADPLLARRLRLRRWSSSTSSSTSRRCSPRSACRRRRVPARRRRAPRPERRCRRRGARRRRAVRDGHRRRAVGLRQRAARPTRSSCRRSASTPRPVTNARVPRVRRGGRLRRRARWWTPAGWAWRSESGAEHPQFWRREGERRWSRARFGRREPLPARRARAARVLVRGRRLRALGGQAAADRGRVGEGGVVGSRRRAAPLSRGVTAPPDERARNLGGALRARRAGRRYPAGAEPVRRVAADGRRVGVDGVATSAPTRASRPSRTAEYSEVFFGDEYKVLRGGSWATHPAAVRTTFRNWDYPIRRQIFAGFRCARDAVTRDRPRAVPRIDVRTSARATARAALRARRPRGAHRDAQGAAAEVVLRRARLGSSSTSITRLPEYYPTRREREILASARGEIAEPTRRRHARRARLGHLGEDAPAARRHGATRAAAALRRLRRERGDAARERRPRSPRSTRASRSTRVVGDFERHLERPPARRPAARRLPRLARIGNLAPDERARVPRTRCAAALEPGRLAPARHRPGEGRRAASWRPTTTRAGVTAEFNRNVLRVVNRELGADFDPSCFDHVARWNAERGVDRDAAALAARAARDRSRRRPDGAVRRGEELRTEISAKFRPDGRREELAAAGFALRELWTDARDEFGLTLAATD